MFREKVLPYPVAAWLLVASSAPLLQQVGKYGWVGTVLTAAAVLALCWMVTLLPMSGIQEKKWFGVAQIGVIILILAEFARWSAECWPTGQDFPIVPLTLLALAVFSAARGASVASRVHGVLFWFLTILYSIVLAAGGKNLKLQWMAAAVDIPGAPMLLALLVPGVGALLPRRQGASTPWVFPVILTFVAAAALWTVGIISPAVAGEVAWPFYEAGKSLRLLGVAERFESLISVAMTMGYFSLYSLLLSVAGAAGEKLKNGWGGKTVVLCGLTAALLTLQMIHTAQGLLVIIAFGAWYLLPFFGGFAELWKKSKKGEKSA